MAYVLSWHLLSVSLIELLHREATKWELLLRGCSLCMMLEEKTVVLIPLHTLPTEQLGRIGAPLAFSALLRMLWPGVLWSCKWCDRIGRNRMSRFLHLRLGHKVDGKKLSTIMMWEVSVCSQQQKWGCMYPLRNSGANWILESPLSCWMATDVTVAYQYQR